MRKLILGAVVVTAVYGAYRWQHESQERPRNLAFNRIWVDHLPTSERDPVHVFAAFPRWAQGGFALETRWHGEVERYRFEIEGDELAAVFPWTGDRERIRLRAYRCDEKDMDYCLEVSGSKRGTTKYYSRNGWEKGNVDDMEAFRATLFENPSGR